MVGPHHAACWVGPHFPNQTTNFEVQDFAVNCTLGPKKACLFRLDVDPEERKDLGAEPSQQNRVAEMLAEIDKARAGAFNPERGVPDKRCCEVGLGKWRGFWGPFSE